jgi:hypothetical protein
MTDMSDDESGELRVPTLALDAEALCADGRRFRGRVFLPPNAQAHDGPMRAEEWMNEHAAFFPFLPEGEARPVLMNKRELLVLTVPAEADEGEIPEGTESPTRRVAVEAERERLEGEIVIDMPHNQARVLDYVNRPGAFLTLRDGKRHHLVQKERITRIVESGDR